MKFAMFPESTSCRPRPYSQSEMLDLGADGYLSKGFLRYIPLAMLDGLEPVPANNESDDGEYHPGIEIKQPIEVAFDSGFDLYMLYAGNHRVAQAKANGQTHILAFVMPDANNLVNHSFGRDFIGTQPKSINPDSIPIPESNKSIPFMIHNDFRAPTHIEIVDVLRKHPLIRLREKVQRVFLVGSFAKESLGVGETHEESDVDILLEIGKSPDESDTDVEQRYRQKLMQHFMTHNIRGKDDSVHPQWCGRRVDVYFCYDANLESRPKIELAAPKARARMKP